MKLVSVNLLASSMDHKFTVVNMLRFLQPRCKKRLYYIVLKMHNYYGLIITHYGSHYFIANPKPSLLIRENLYGGSLSGSISNIIENHLGFTQQAISGQKGRYLVHTNYNRTQLRNSISLRVTLGLPNKPS